MTQRLAAGSESFKFDEVEATGTVTVWSVTGGSQWQTAIEHLVFKQKYVEHCKFVDFAELIACKQREMLRKCQRPFQLSRNFAGNFRCPLRAKPKLKAHMPVQNRNFYSAVSDFLPCYCVVAHTRWRL